MAESRIMKFRHNMSKNISISLSFTQFQQQLREKESDISQLKGTILDKEEALTALQVSRKLLEQKFAEFQSVSIHTEN